MSRSFATKPWIEIPGDAIQVLELLPWILITCLSKRPITARPASLVLQLRRASQRHPGRAVGAVAVLVFFLGFLPWTLWQQRQARLASEQEVQQTQLALAAAQFNLDLAYDAVDQFLTEIGAYRTTDIPLLEQARRELLEDAAEFYLKIIESSPEDARGALGLATAYQRLASVQFELGQYSESVASAQLALDLVPQLNDADPPIDSRQRLHVEIQQILAAAALNLRQFELAEKHLLLAQSELERVRITAGQDPAINELQRSLYRQFGTLYHESTRFEEAESAYRASLALAEPELPRTVDDLFNSASVHVNLGNLASRRGDGSASREHLRQAISELEQLLTMAPNSALYRLAHVNACESLAITEVSWFSRHEMALAVLANASVMADELCRDFPQQPSLPAKVCADSLARGSVESCVDKRRGI